METSQRFYLSYARADNSQLVRRFFEDLSDTIRDGLNLHTQSESVGFYEETEYGPTSNWSLGAQDALQNSRVMVCLLSPAYLRSTRCGKEWEIFELRRRQYLKREDLRGTLAETLARIIVPVTWISCPGPVPRIVAELLAHPDRLYQSRPMMTMLRSSAMFKGEYVELVKSLASQIIELTAESNLLPLPTLPAMNKAQGAFHLWDDMTSAQSHDCKGHSDAGCDKPKRGAGRADPFNPPAPPAAPASSQTEVKPYSVLAISKDKLVLDPIVRRCRYSPLFKVETEADPELAMLRTAKTPKELLPDLFVIDLDNETPGVEIIQKLTQDRKVASGILALSFDFEKIPLHQVMAATAILPKFYHSPELLAKMEYCARIGRRVRDKRARDKDNPDPLRSREVFLSFCHDDITPATFLRRNLEADLIGVGYSRDIEVGDEWEKRIRTWIAQARVFIALVTPNYLTSTECEGELSAFTQRLEKEESAAQRPVLMSVLYNKPNIHENESIAKCINPYQSVEMSHDDYLTGFHALRESILDVLGRPS